MPTNFHQPVFIQLVLYFILIFQIYIDSRTDILIITRFYPFQEKKQYTDDEITFYSLQSGEFILAIIMFSN